MVLVCSHGKKRGKIQLVSIGRNLHGETERFVWPKIALFISYFFFLHFYNVLNKTALTSNHKRNMFCVFQDLKKLS